MARPLAIGRPMDDDGSVVLAGVQPHWLAVAADVCAGIALTLLTAAVCTLIARHARPLAYGAFLTGVLTVWVFLVTVDGSVAWVFVSLLAPGWAVLACIRTIEPGPTRHRRTGWRPPDARPDTPWSRRGPADAITRR